MVSKIIGDEETKYYICNDCGNVDELEIWENEVCFLCDSEDIKELTQEEFLEYKR